MAVGIDLDGRGFVIRTDASKLMHALYHLINMKLCGHRLDILRRV